MGYIRHGAVLVTASGYIQQPDVESFRRSLPDQWQRLVVGPVKAITNNYVTYAFLPDGSKEGWRDSDQGDEYREQFVKLFLAGYEDGSMPFNVVVLEYGGDDDDKPSIVPLLEFDRRLP